MTHLMSHSLKISYSASELFIKNTKVRAAIKAYKPSTIDWMK
jgi:hypothetical protein